MSHPRSARTNARSVATRLFSEESARSVATLIRVPGDFALAEEAVQEASPWPWNGGG